MWRLGTRFSGGLGSVSLTVGLDDLKSLFQPKIFYDSMTLEMICMPKADTCSMSPKTTNLMSLERKGCLLYYIEYCRTQHRCC